MEWCPEIFAVLPWIFALGQTQVKTGSQIRSMRAFSDSWFAFVSVWVVFLWEIVVAGLAFGLYGAISAFTLGSAVVLSVRESPDVMRVMRWSAGVSLVIFIFAGMSPLWAILTLTFIACGLQDEYVKMCLAAAEKVWPAVTVLLIIAQQLFAQTKILWVLLCKDAALALSYFLFIAKQLGKLAGFG